MTATIENMVRVGRVQRHREFPMHTAKHFAVSAIHHAEAPVVGGYISVTRNSVRRYTFATDTELKALRTGELAAVSVPGRYLNNIWTIRRLENGRLEYTSSVPLDVDIDDVRAEFVD